MFRLIVVRCLLSILIGCGGKQKATADTDVPVSVDSMPSLVSMPEPYYPEATKESGGKGEVIIRALINTDGEVGATNVEKSSGYPELDAAAISAVHVAKYNPALKDGDPVGIWISISVPFFPESGVIPGADKY